MSELDELLENRSEPTSEEERAMRTVQKALVDALVTHERVPAWIRCVALIRCCRTLLRKHDRESQRDLLLVLISFLRGAATQPRDSQIVIPKGMLH